MKEDLLIKHRNLKGWLICSQTVIAILFTVLYPLVFSLILSFTDTKLNMDKLHFIGFDNYKWVFTPENGFWSSLFVSLTFSVISTVLQTVLGFLVAVMLYFLTKRLQGVFKTIIYLPVVLPAAVISAMWLLVFAGDEYGLLNMVLGLTSPAKQWLGGSKELAFAVIIFVNTWRYLGITMVIYFVNMNAVSKDIVESAGLDGANKFRIMMKIIFPLTWSASVINVLQSFIGGIKTFDLFYLFQTNGSMTTKLTPVSVLIFRAGLGNKNVFDISLSRSVTMSIMLAIIIAGLTITVNKLMDRKEK